MGTIDRDNSQFVIGVEIPNSSMAERRALLPRVAVAEWEPTGLTVSAVEGVTANIPVIEEAGHIQLPLGHIARNGDFTEHVQ